MSKAPWLKLEDLSLLAKPKHRVTTHQMKAFDEYILMVQFLLLLNRVHFLVNESSKGVTTQMKASMSTF